MQHHHHHPHHHHQPLGHQSEQSSHSRARSCRPSPPFPLPPSDPPRASPERHEHVGHGARSCGPRLNIQRVQPGRRLTEPAETKEAPSRRARAQASRVQVVLCSVARQKAQWPTTPHPPQSHQPHQPHHHQHQPDRRQPHRLLQGCLPRRRAKEHDSSPGTNKTCHDSVQKARCLPIQNGSRYYTIHVCVLMLQGIIHESPPLWDTRLLRSNSNGKTQIVNE